MVGLYGDASTIDLAAIEEQCNGMSSKPVKKNIRDKVSFKFKEKGKKPINATGVASFMFTGADFNVDRLAELLEGQSIISLD